MMFFLHNISSTPTPHWLELGFGKEGGGENMKIREQILYLSWEKHLHLTQNFYFVLILNLI